MTTTKYDGLIIELETARYAGPVLKQRTIEGLGLHNYDFTIDDGLVYIETYLPMHAFFLRDGYCELRHNYNAKFDVIANAASPTLAIWAAILKAERAIKNANINS